MIRANQLPAKTDSVELRVRIDGRSLAKVNVPLEDGIEGTPPIVVDMSANSERNANVELEFRSPRLAAAFELLGATIQFDSG